MDERHDVLSSSEYFHLDLDKTFLYVDLSYNLVLHPKFARKQAREQRTCLCLISSSIPANSNVKYSTPSMHISLVVVPTPERTRWKITRKHFP